jgi:hypothetical protein
MITAAELARALVERLIPILPAGFAVRAADGTVYIEAPDGLGGATSVAELLDPDDLEPDDYASAAWMVLSMAQDVVSETTTEPWPVALGGAADLAEPGTRVEGRQIALYFGAEDQPVLTLQPIPL